ncbi:hypothetical protein SAMN05192555_102434 [Franzmannia pantelleriensis]|uniref:Uncharacterized protein n=1 Tax=Franzmannia pantelleriensis TaxID=48727 RepID=A0A1G9HDI1_9GAMM|nr:hypothetical protein SAMN05192555_102434 [Halomonas pantelleriensis]
MSAGDKAERGSFAMEGKSSAQGWVHSALAQACSRQSPRLRKTLMVYLEKTNASRL